jgi:pyruvate dehydrogenase E2 component (dihydrolipoamide acetyltransferase)
VKASPLARRLAAETGVALSNVSGSGPGGRIVKRDIEAAGTAAPAAKAEAPTKRAAPTPQRAAPRDGADVEEIPVTQMRKTIAKRLVTSIGPVPTFYLTIEADVSNLVAARERINKRLEDSGIKASINDFIIKAVAAALRQHPEVNASWDDIVVKRYHRVHIGVAVAVEDGLITPIVRDADQKGIAEISGEVRDLAKRARDKKLKPDEYTGATFSISNLGMFGIDEFTAIINPPEAAILAIGQVADQVVAENGQPVVRSRMRMTMSCDHRVIDGATGARFLQTLRNYIEEPMMILV